MNSDRMESLIACLESARKRPGMCFGKVDVEAALHFLTGFEVALGPLYGFDQVRELREQVGRERGWSWTANHPSRAMVRRGMSAESVIDELLVIEIEVVRRLAQALTGHDPKD
jgi:hypothetical protein